MITTSNTEPIKEEITKLVMGRSQLPDSLISLVQSMREDSIDCSVARYFCTTAPRDPACSSVVAKLSHLLKFFLPQELPCGGLSRQSSALPCIFNGSGSGKTFFNYFLLDHIRAYTRTNPTVQPIVSHFLAKYRVLRVWITQADYDQQVATNETDLNLYIGAVAASQLLLEEQRDGVLRGVKVSSLLKEIRETRTGWIFKDTPVLLRAIRKVQNIPDDEPFLIIFGHDDMHKLTNTTELRNLDSQGRQKSKVYKYIVSVMEFTMDAANFNIPVFNLFTGTFPLNSSSLLPPYMYQFSPVIFTPLTLADGIDLLKAQHPSLKYALETEHMTALMKMFGNVPGIWELFSKQLEIHSNSLIPSKDGDVVEICNTFAKQVKRWSIPHVMFDTVLLVMVQRWSVGKIGSLFGFHEIDGLLYDGRVFTDDGGSLFVPMITLRNSVQRLDAKDPTRMIFKDYMDLYLRGEFDDRYFGQFCLSFLAMKFNLFVKRNISFDELFKGAWSSSLETRSRFKIGNKLIKEIYECEQNTMPCEIMKVKSCSHLEFGDIREEIPLAVWSGKTDEHQDAALFLPNGVSIHFRTKYVDGQEKLIDQSSETFVREQEMEKSPFRQNPLFLFITNQPMSDEEVTLATMNERSFVVCANNFNEFFSGMFSFLAVK